MHFIQARIARHSWGGGSIDAPKGVECGEGVPSPLGKRSVPLPRKFGTFSLEMAHFGANSVVYMASGVIGAQCSRY